MNFANPAALIFLLLMPAVILLYFLRLRRREVIVSSTLLWSRVLEDRRVNSPFQKFRRNLLLLLQLLALAALTAALLQPQQESDMSIGRTHLLLVDVSASMGVIEEGSSRLDLARQRVQDYLDGIVRDERAVLIRFARRAMAVTPVTSDLKIIERAVGELEVRPARTN